MLAYILTRLSITVEKKFNKDKVRFILNYLDQGFRYKEIADKMNLSFETIRTYCRNIYEILQVHSRTDALNKVFPKK